MKIRWFVRILTLEHVKTGLQTMPYYLIVPLFYDL